MSAAPLQKPTPPFTRYDASETPTERETGDAVTRARTQILLMALYGLIGVGAFLAPGLVADILMMEDGDRTSDTLFLMRVFGASSGLIALLLFFFIANAGAGRRLMVTLALYEALAIVGAFLAYTADDLGADTTVISMAGSAVLAVLSIWGGFGAERRVREAEPEAT